MKPLRRQTLRRSGFAIAALACALLAGQILHVANRQMDDHDLRGYTELANVPPSIELATKTLGCFRAFAITTLWIRASNLQDEGKFFELNDLFHMISRLEPRFPMVWAYWAWNVSYNCSVKFPAVQPEERWRWVTMGLEILRDRGIAENPRAAVLYRELAWIYSHKLGQDQDDAHQYYKVQLATQMQEALGEPPYAERLRTLADAPRTQAELLRDAPVRTLADRLEQAGTDPFNSPLRIANRVPDLPDPIRALLDDPANAQAAQRLDAFLRAHHLRRNLKLEPGGIPLAIGDILDWTRFAEHLKTQSEAQGPSVCKTLWAGLPQEARDAVADAATGKPLPHNRKDILVRSINAVLGKPGLYRKTLERDRRLPDRSISVLRLEPDNVTDADILTLNRDILQLACPDDLAEPGMMLRLTERYGPIDWRLPDAHALYWAARGIELFGMDPFNAANADRIFFHSLVNLYRRGHLRFRPATDDEGAMWVGATNFAFLETVVKLHTEIAERHRGSGWETPTQEGYYNFLRDVVLNLYLHSDYPKANTYLKKLIKDGGQTETSLDEFVWKRFGEMMEAMTYQQAGNMIRGFFYQSLFWASVGNADQAKGQDNLARLLYKKYIETHSAERFKLPTLQQLWTDALRQALDSLRSFQRDQLRDLYPAATRRIDDERKKARERARPAAPAPPRS